MVNEISRAEAWTRAHEVFTRVNFNAFDYNTIKESLLDYMKLYFPEDFNSYIESSEFIAILELFAYVGELLAYRLDLNAHENFITTAERKESILRLAKLISYSASRNVPARGLVKITSIQTTEQIFDAQGRNLANTNLIWNDLNNPDWKEQFLTVMNRVLEQPFGTVTPNERVQIEDVLFELYTWNNQPLSGNGITTFKYSIPAAGTTFPLELVPVALTAASPIEKRPERNGKFSLLYGADGLGDGSDTTGFFLYTKQGTLQVREANFDGLTTNQTFDVATNNINETDVWLNNVDPNTREIISTNPFAQQLPHLDSNTGRFGEWSTVNASNTQNIFFNIVNKRQQFEIETLDNDQIRLIFGDGEFSDIPNGAFDIWYRISANSNSAIPQTSANELTASFTYLDISNTTQTFTFTFALINSLQNASVSEDIEHIRRVAPSVYYTQDRMVNGRDYNSFMLQDPSILKLRAVNRTFSGDSKYIAWHDPKEYYEDVKIFGEDMALYWINNVVENGGLITSNTALTSSEVISNLIEPLLCSSDLYNIMIGLFQNASMQLVEHCTFTPAEVSVIQSALDFAATSSNPQVDLYFSATGDEWTVGESISYTDSVFLIRIEAIFTASSLSGWTIRWATSRMNVQSQTTRFRNTNTTSRIVNFDTLNSNDDNILILNANANGSENALLGSNKKYNVLGQELVEQNLPNAGLPDDNRLSVIPTDTDDDGIPNDIEQTDLLNAIYTTVIAVAGTGILFDFQSLSNPAPGTQLPNANAMYFMENTHLESVSVKVNNTTITTWVPGPVIPGTNEIHSIIITSPLSVSDILEISTKRFVYFHRPTITDQWVPVVDNSANRALWFADSLNLLYKREEGRFPLNFAWFYTTPRFHLVDPAASNIIDMFIITTSYYQELTRYLNNSTTIMPTLPTPLDLRTSYAGLLQNAMISDTVILHPGTFKILFGERAIPELRGVFKVLRPDNTSLTDNEVKVRIVDTIKRFFNITDWNFGSTFYLTELLAAIHVDLGAEIRSIVLVPTFTTNQFGDLFQVQAREDEIFIADINTTDVDIIQSFTAENIRQ